MNSLTQSIRNTIDRNLLKEDRKAHVIIDGVIQSTSHLTPMNQLHTICYLWDHGEQLTSAKYKDSFIYNLGLEASRLYRKLGGQHMRTLKALRVHTRHTENNVTLFHRIKEQGYTEQLKAQLEDYLNSIDEFIPIKFPKREFEIEIWRSIQADLSVALPTIQEKADTPTKIVVSRLLRPITC